MKGFNGFSILPVVFAVCLIAVTASAQQAAVDLGSNSGFAILAGTTVTVTGGGAITGDIGISPGSAFVPGVPPVVVNGTIHAGDATAAQAQADLTTAFNDAAGRQTPVTVAGNIGGQTLTPGLYKSTSSLAVSSGDLTLDAQGDANAVFIFQIASSFTMTSGRRVLLSGGAKAENIFWQVGSSATLGTTATLHGSVLAAISISALTGARLHGRALARSGAVTVDTGGGNSVALPGAQTPTRPRVISTVPASGASGVAVNNRISATFSEAMDPSTITTSTFTLKRGTTSVSGNVTYSGRTATFNPASSLASLTAYTATISGGAHDLAGNALNSNHVWSFTTGAAQDATRPSVISTVPASGALGVAVDNTVSATFSEAMDPATITAGSFTLRQGTTPVSGAVTYSGRTASFTPASALASFATFSATITSGATDLAGNALNSNYVWNFSTDAELSLSPVISPAGTTNNSFGTVNLASYATPVAAGSIAGVFGSNLAIGESDPQVPNPLPFTLAQSSIDIGGEAAPLYFASPAQVNLQIPWELAGETHASIRATVGGVVSSPQMVSLAPFAPGIFTVDWTGTGQGAILIAPTARLAAPGTPVLRGEYISIFCTGLGAVTDQPATGVPGRASPLSFSLTMPRVAIDGVEAEVTYSGLAPGFAGLYQVNAQVPAGVSAGDAVPVDIRIGGVTSNTVTIAVQ